MTTLSMPATMTQLPKEIDGYPILSLIGEGAFSKIYAAKDPKTRQLLALKHVIINDPKKDERWVEQMESETKMVAWTILCCGKCFISNGNAAG